MADPAPRFLCQPERSFLCGGVPAPDQDHRPSVPEFCPTAFSVGNRLDGAALSMRIASAVSGREAKRVSAAHVIGDEVYRPLLVEPGRALVFGNRCVAVVLSGSLP